jgi:glycosyltransferase involved in cell wall biosynthesis
MICDEALSRELAACAATWPGQYTLVLHERERRSPDEPYLRRIAELGGDRVRLSLEPVPLDELDRVTSAGDVGIALYRGDLGPNFSQMAAASGRLAYYLRSGLPVICPDLPGFREVVDGYRCGVCVQDAAAVGAALERIFDAYPIHRQNALRCFKERYDFARCFAPVLDAMLTRLPSHVGVGRHG